MTRASSITAPRTSAEDLEQHVRARVDSLSYLPTTAGVAMKFVELGQDPEAEPADYAKVIGADSSLTSKLLALANSSWAGVRSEVTNVRMAVNLLGLGTVRTLAISYCMTGLHNELRLSANESRMFWEASLCKAVAAKRYASLFDKKRGDEAFVTGLFQDFAVTVMYSTAREPLLAVLQDPSNCVRTQVQKERALFRLDHAEVGRLLAQKLELPELFVDAVAFHHNHERLVEFIENEALRDATYVAGLLPHLLGTWGREDVDALAAFVEQHAPGTDLSAYLKGVQEEFGQLYCFFQEGRVPDAQLTTLLEHAAREAADKTEELVGAVNELTRNMAAMGAAVDEGAGALDDGRQRARPTGVLSPAGLSSSAEELLAKTARYGSALAVLRMDVDRYSEIEDGRGRELSERVLKMVAAELAAILPKDALIGRVGEAEFVGLLVDCTERGAREIGQRIVSELAHKSIRESGSPAYLTLSVGLLYVQPTNQPHRLDALLNAAGKLLHLAKRPGGNRLQIKTVGTGG